MSKWVRLSRERALRFCGFLHLIPWWSDITKISFGKYFLWDIKWCPKELWKSWWEGKGPLCSRECFTIQAGRWINVSGPFQPNCIPFAVSLFTVIFWSFFLLSLIKGLLQEPMATQKWFLSTHLTAKMHSDSWSCYCSVPLCLVLQEKKKRPFQLELLRVVIRMDSHITDPVFKIQFFSLLVTFSNWHVFIKCLRGLPRFLLIPRKFYYLFLHKPS